MTHPTPDPSADAWLRAFFAAHQEPGLAAFECDLRHAIERTAEGILAPHARVLLAAERQFDGIGAGARVLTAADLPRALAVYLADPLFRPGLGAGARLGCCRAMLRALAGDPAVHGSTRALIAVEAAIRAESARPPAVTGTAC